MDVDERQKPKVSSHRETGGNRVHFRQMAQHMEQDGPYHGIGKDLEAARVKSGMSIPQVAQALRIQASHIEALETGHVGALPGATYAIGFLRTYADYLGLDSEAAVARFKEEEAVRADPTRLVFPEPVGAARRPGWRVAVVSLAVLAAFYGGWVFLQRQGLPQFESVEAPPERLTGLLKSDASGVDEAVTPAPAEAGVTAAGPAAASGEEPEQDAGAVEEPAAAAPPPAAATEPEQRTAARDSAAPAGDTEPAQPATRAATDTTGTDAAATDTAPTDTTAADTTAADTGSADTGPQAERAAAVVPQVSRVEPTRVEVPEREPVHAAEEMLGAAPQSRAGEEAAEADASRPDETVAAADSRPDSPVDADPAAATATERTSEPAADDAAEDDTPAPTPATESTVAVATPAPATSQARVDDAAARGSAVRRPGAVEVRPLPAAPPAPPTSSIASEAERPGLARGYRPQVFGAANADARVVIRARDDSWVQVQGPNNELLLTRILRAGDVYHAPDRSDLKLMTGNAGAIEVIVDGESLGPLGPDGQVRRDVALDADGLRNVLGSGGASDG